MKLVPNGAVAAGFLNLVVHVGCVCTTLPRPHRTTPEASACRADLPPAKLDPAKLNGERHANLGMIPAVWEACHTASACTSSKFGD